MKKLKEGSSPSLPSLSAEQQLHVEVVACGSALWVRLRGEADLANHEQLWTELREVGLDRVRTVHLVLADLTFCDLYAFRHLVTFAARVLANGRVLYAHEPRPVLRKLATLLDVTQQLHFV